MIFMQFCISCLITALLFVGVIVSYQCYLEEEHGMGILVFGIIVLITSALGFFAFGGAL